MKNKNKYAHGFLFAALSALAVLTLSGASASSTDVATQHAAADSAPRKIVVANRGDGTITVINARTSQRIRDVALPAAANPSEPMYVVNTVASGRNLVWVGDRANNRVVAFDANSFEVVRILPTGAGVFHMWADSIGRQLWVVNDIDNSVTVIDVLKLRVANTFKMPADLVAAGAKPHDVVLDTFGRTAYVTLVGTALTADVVVQLDTYSGRELRRMPVGKDPHVSYNSRTRQIFSPNQGTNNVFVLDANDLSVDDIIAIPGAHGAITTLDARRFYTTNISGGGVNAVYAIDTRTGALSTQPVSTKFAAPHNLAVTPGGRRLYVTHSGATSDRVSVIEVMSDGQLRTVSDVQVGLNPFGLAFVR